MVYWLQSHMDPPNSKSSFSIPSFSPTNTTQTHTQESKEKHIMAVANFVLPWSSNAAMSPQAKNPFIHLSSLSKESQIFKSNAEVSFRKTAGTNSNSLRAKKSVKAIFIPQLVPTPTPIPQPVSRKDFPTDFKFGCSTSALQTEGSGTEGGRGPSTWDSFIQTDSGTTDIAVDSYNRYKEDVQLLKQMGADAYRFSISWSRILPEGTGKVNQAGIDFYNNFIDELVKNGITPCVTLFHFDLPTALQKKYYGFLDSKIVDDFKAYADICFKNFGDRVKFWITINEPQVFGQYGYRMELTKPDANAVTDPYVAIHNIILTHAAAANLYKTTYQPTQKGQIGISLVTEWFLPASDTKADRDAAERAWDNLTGWMLEPLVFGDYPFIMKALVRDALPTFTDEQKTSIKGSFDFIGVNYYTSRFAKSLPLTSDEKYTNQADYQRVEVSVENNGKPIGDKAPGSNEIYVYPPGLGAALEYITNNYDKPTIYITENGYPEKRDDSVAVDTALKDDARIQHIIDHLHYIKEAMKKGSNIKGYFMWALMDCLEMGSGYNVRFGLNYTDYKDNLKRTPKKSAGWLKAFVNAK